MFFESEEKRIKRQIQQRAEKLATEMYEKEVMFKSLQASDLNYSIIQDLIKAADFTGKVEIIFKDGTKVEIKSEEPRKTLNNLDDQKLF